MKTATRLRRASEPSHSKGRGHRQATAFLRNRAPPPYNTRQNANGYPELRGLRCKSHRLRYFRLFGVGQVTLVFLLMLNTLLTRRE